MFSCEDRKSNCCANAALCARAKTLFCRTCALNWQPPVILSGQQISRIISQEDIIFGGKWLTEITGKTSSSIRAKFPKKMLRVVWKGGSYEEIRKTRSKRNTLVVSMDHAYSSSKLILCQRITLIFNLMFFFLHRYYHLSIWKSLNKCIFHLHVSPHILNQTTLNSIKSLTTLYHFFKWDDCGKLLD